MARVFAESGGPGCVKEMGQFDGVLLDQGIDEASGGKVQCLLLKGQIMDQGPLQQLWKTQAPPRVSQLEGGLQGLGKVVVEGWEGVPTEPIKLQKEKLPIEVEVLYLMQESKGQSLPGEGFPTKNRY